MFYNFGARTKHSDQRLKLSWCVFQNGNLQGLDEGDILDPEFQQRLEDARILLRQEIQRELKIKEAAERLRRAVTNRKSAADVEGQLKASSRKLDKLHWELQELNARSMAAEKDRTTGNSNRGCAGELFLIQRQHLNPSSSYRNSQDLISKDIPQLMKGLSVCPFGHFWSGPGEDNLDSYCQVGLKFS